MNSETELAKEIESNLNPTIRQKIKIKTEMSVSSTNDIVWNECLNGVEEGYTLAAEQQTKGRGQYKRSFISPSGSGIYFSIALRPQFSFESSLMIMPIAAVATARAIEKISDQTAQIKWVNDVFCQNKKVCGILAESSLKADGNSIDFIVLGIGVNLSAPQGGFPEEIKDTAGAIFSDYNKAIQERGSLVSTIINEFFSIYEKLPEKTFLEEYRSRSNIIGKKITISEGSQTELGVALDIDDMCRLIVKTDNGETKALSSGEARIRPI